MQEHSCRQQHKAISYLKSMAPRGVVTKTITMEEKGSAEQSALFFYKFFSNKSVEKEAEFRLG